MQSASQGDDSEGGKSGGNLKYKFTDEDKVIKSPPEGFISRCSVEKEFKFSKLVQILLNTSIYKS